MSEQKENLFKRLRRAMGVSAIKDMTAEQIDEVFQSLHDKNVALTEELEALKRERDELKGLTPELPPRPPEGFGLPRYGLRWNGANKPLSVPMEDGYWTPYHLAEQFSAQRDIEQQIKALEELRRLMTENVSTRDIFTWREVNDGIAEYIEQLRKGGE